MGESNVFNEMRKEWGDRTRLETTRHHVLALLEGRFPGQAPEDVRRLIAQVDSQETLDRWFLALARAKDYGDFDAALRK